MSLALIRAQVKVILLTATGVGTNVYEYERWSNNWKDYLDLFKTGSLIKGWTISRVGTPEIAQTPSTNLRNHNFMIRGYYSLDDSEESELDFQAIIEAVAEKFRINPYLNDTAFESEPLQVELVGMVMFGDVLCHFCQLRLVAQEEEQWR